MCLLLLSLASEHSPYFICFHLCFIRATHPPPKVLLLQASGVDVQQGLEREALDGDEGDEEEMQRVAALTLCESHLWELNLKNKFDWFL